MKTQELPPYGVMEESIERSIAKRPVPEAWLALDGANAQANYKAWRDTLVADLASLLWPTYDRARGKWTSPPDSDLIDADFDLMKDLRLKMKEAVKGVASEPTTHEVFYAEEDDERTIFGARYERYDPALPVFLRESLTDILWSGCDRKMGSMHFQVKQEFQRPRPYQVAFMQRRDFHHAWAKTGGTPSMISGHCLQGATGGCSAFLLFGRSLDSVSLDVLKQLTVDIGDRRVFAGVHYPSDNLSSWYTAFKLLPHVVEASSVAPAMAFLWEAISTKSDVFAAIQEHADSHATSPFKPAMEAIRNAAGPAALGNQLVSASAAYAASNGGGARPS
jgi:hypothetical protein